MIAQLSELSHAALPTPFHQILRALDDRGKLLRVYTQNIDAIESKSGLSFGVPDFDDRRKPRSKSKAAVPAEDEPSTPVSSQTPSSRLPTPPSETPRCIPLHGTLQTLHCQTCTHSFPLDDYLPSLMSGTPPYCPECTAMEETRQLVGKRARGVGKLRPSVVLYNEMHKDGEGVGEAVRKDLVGGSRGKGRSGADLLLVVGTSLRVPGTKRIVREFAKAVHSRSAATASAKDGASSGLATPTPSPRRSPASDEEPSMKAVYLNFDFPVPTREWEGVFDAWVQGDAQTFAEMLGQEIEKEMKAKEIAAEKKKKREEDALLAALEEVSQTQQSKKRKSTSSDTLSSSSKKRKLTILPPTPTSAKGKRKKQTTVAKSKIKPLSQKASNAKAGSSRGHSRSSLSRKGLVPEVYISTLAYKLSRPEPLDREDDLARDPGGKWIRGPLVLPGHSEVPPMVEQVDDYRSFKMFDAGWILPESQKRGGRAATQRSAVPTRRRNSVKSAAISPSTPIDDPHHSADIVGKDFTEHPGDLPVILLRTSS